MGLGMSGGLGMLGGLGMSGGLGLPGPVPDRLVMPACGFGLGRGLASHGAAVPRRGARLLFGRQKLVVEFSGAATVAALRSGRLDVEGQAVAAILSGGNLDPSLVPELL